VSFEAFHAFAHAAHPVGAWVLGTAVGAMVVDLIALVTYTLRHGHSDGRAGKTEITNSLMSPFMRPGGVRAGSWSRRILVSRNVVSNASLADGTATVGERLVVVGIIAFICCFVLVFLGGALLVMDEFPIAPVAPVFVGIWAFKLFKTARDDQREAKRARAGS
jgi:hypothetical protein